MFVSRRSFVSFEKLNANLNHTFADEQEESTRIIIEIFALLTVNAAD